MDPYRFNTANFHAQLLNNDHDTLSEYLYSYNYPPVCLSIDEMDDGFAFLNEVVRQTSQYRDLIRLSPHLEADQRIAKQMTPDELLAYKAVTTKVDMNKFLFRIKINEFKTKTRGVFMSFGQVMTWVLDFLRTRETKEADPCHPMWRKMRVQLEAYMAMLARVAATKSPERPWSVLMQHHAATPATNVHGGENADAMVHTLRMLAVFYPKAFWYTFWMWALDKEPEYSRWKNEEEEEAMRKVQRLAEADGKADKKTEPTLHSYSYTRFSRSLWKPHGDDLTINYTRLIHFLYERVIVPFESNHEILVSAKRQLKKLWEFHFQRHRISVQEAEVGYRIVQKLFPDAADQALFLVPESAAAAAVGGKRGRGSTAMTASGMANMLLLYKAMMVKDAYSLH